MTDHLTDAALQAVELEREAQDARWGEQNHPDGTGTPSSAAMAYDTAVDCGEAFAQGRGTWRHLLNVEVREAFAEDDPEKLQAELIQVAAVALAWHESIARRATGAQL